jgi:hypothetical protein
MIRSNSVPLALAKEKRRRDGINLANAKKAGAPRYSGVHHTPKLNARDVLPRLKRKPIT